MSTMTTTRTTTFTVQPWATILMDEDTMVALADALEADERALGAVVGYDPERARVDATFQVELEPVTVTKPMPSSTWDLLGSPAQVAREIFDSALEQAGCSERTTGVSVVEGDDPDQLP